MDAAGAISEMHVLEDTTSCCDPCAAPVQFIQDDTILLLQAGCAVLHQSVGAYPRSVQSLQSAIDIYAQQLVSCMQQACLHVPATKHGIALLGGSEGVRKIPHMSANNPGQECVLSMQKSICDQSILLACVVGMFFWSNIVDNTTKIEGSMIVALVECIVVTARNTKQTNTEHQRSSNVTSTMHVEGLNAMKVRVIPAIA